jgi:hypothetical protein
VVGPAHDAYEREADRVAEQAARRPAARPQQREDADTADVRARPNPQHSRARTAGVPDDLQRAMHVAHTSGRALPASLKEEFETALGADFGAVRVHAGEQAAQLSRGLQAQAFTHGPDVFFGAGRYAPGTAASKRLLAHELTHVIQQGWAPPLRDRAPDGPSTPIVRTPRGDAAPGGPAGRIQRKLSFEHTAWPDARSVWPSKGGFRGVVFVTDEVLDAPPPRPSPGNDPVVLKTGEDAPAEVFLAANLHGYGRDLGVWPSNAPAVRTVEPAEGEQIMRHLPNRMFYMPEGLLTDAQQKRVIEIINRADKPGAMVFEYAGGEDFQRLLKQPGHSEKKSLGGGSHLRKDSPARLFKDEGFMEALGRLAAIDIFTGNTDRLLSFNPENFRIDRKTIWLIDNVFYKLPQSAFKTSTNPEFLYTSQEGYNAWSTNEWTRMLQKKQWAGIAHKILDPIEGSLEGTLQLPRHDAQTIGKAVRKADKWLIQGLKEGETWLRLAARDLRRLTQGIASEDVKEVQASIMWRMHFLFPDLFGAELFGAEKRRVLD